MKTYIQLFRRLLSAKTLSRALIIILSLGAFPVHAMFASKGAQALINKSTQSLIKPVINFISKKSVSTPVSSLLKLSKLQGNLPKASGVQELNASHSFLVRDKFGALQLNLSEFTGASHKKKFHSRASDAQMSSVLDKSIYQRWAANNTGILAALAALAGVGYAYAECEDKQVSVDAPQGVAESYVHENTTNLAQFTDQEWLEIDTILNGLGFTREDARQNFLLAFSGVNPYSLLSTRRWKESPYDACRRIGCLAQENKVFERFVMGYIDKDFLLSCCKGNCNYVGSLVTNSSLCALRVSKIFDRELFNAWIQDFRGIELLEYLYDQKFLGAHDIVDFIDLKSSYKILGEYHGRALLRAFAHREETIFKDLVKFLVKESQYSSKDCQETKRIISNLLKLDPLPARAIFSSLPFEALDSYFSSNEEPFTIVRHVSFVDFVEFNQDQFLKALEWLGFIGVVQAKVDSDPDQAHALSRLLNKEVFDKLSSLDAGRKAINSLFSMPEMQKVVASFADEKFFNQCINDTAGRSADDIQFGLGLADFLVSVDESLLLKMKRQFVKAFLEELELEVPDGGNFLSPFGCSLLEKILKSEPAYARKIAQYISPDKAESFAKTGYGLRLFALLIQADEGLISLVPAHLKVNSVEELLNLSTKRGGACLAKAMQNHFSDDLKAFSWTQTLNHIAHNEFCTPIPENYISDPVLKNLLTDVIALEKEYQETHYTFIHGQRREYYLAEQLQTLLWSIDNNSFVQDYVFPHIQPKPSLRELVKEDMIHRKVLERGRYDYDSRQLLLFLNGPLFGNSHNQGSSSARYIYDNDNAGDFSFTCKQVFENYGRSDLYELFKDKIDQLERLYINVCPYGNALFVAVPKEQAQDLVFPAVTGGGRKEIEIAGIGKTSNIHEILKTLKENPDKLRFRKHVDEIEYCLFLGHSRGAQNPQLGVKIIPLVTADKAKLAGLERGRCALFDEIRKHVEDTKREDMYKSCWL